MCFAKRSEFWPRFFSLVDMQQPATTTGQIMNTVVDLLNWPAADKSGGTTHGCLRNSRYLYLLRRPLWCGWAAEAPSRWFTKMDRRGPIHLMVVLYRPFYISIFQHVSYGSKWWGNNGRYRCCTCETVLAICKFHVRKLRTTSTASLQGRRPTLCNVEFWGSSDKGIGEYRGTCLNQLVFWKFRMFRMSRAFSVSVLLWILSGLGTEKVTQLTSEQDWILWESSAPIKKRPFQKRYRKDDATCCCEEEGVPTI